MIKFITDIQGNEPGIMTLFKHNNLLITDLNDKPMKVIVVPDGGWTHDLLQEQVVTLEPNTKDGASAYLGKQWVGSTEV